MAMDLEHHWAQCPVVRSIHVMQLLSPRTAQKCIDQQWHWADIAISLAKALLRRGHGKKTWSEKKNPKILQMTSSAVWWSQWYFKSIIWPVFLRARKSFWRDFQVFEDQNLPTVSRSTYNHLSKKKVNQMYSVTWNIHHYRKESKCSLSWKWT